MLLYYTLSFRVLFYACIQTKRKLTLIVDDPIYSKLHQLGNLRVILLPHTLYELPNLKNLES